MVQSPSCHDIGPSTKVDEKSSVSATELHTRAECADEEKRDGIENGRHSCSISTDASVSKSHSGDTPFNLDQYPEFWNLYNAEAAKEDEEIVGNFAADLDNLLLFAGIFSAINTAFIIESYKDLKEDKPETTNQLLRSLIRTSHQPSLDESDLYLSSFIAANRAIRVNVFLIISLSLSLFAAFGAANAKYMINRYRKYKHFESRSARGMERHRRYLLLFGTSLFRTTVENLPGFLQLSLIFFLAGLSDFLMPLNQGLSIVLVVLSLILLYYCLIGTLFGTSWTLPESALPQLELFQVVFAKLKQLNGQNIRMVLPEMVQELIQVPAISSWLSDMNLRFHEREVLEAHCVAWLKRRTASTIGPSSVVVRAALLLTPRARKRVKLHNNGSLLRYLVQSYINEGKVFLGATSEEIRLSLPVLQDLIVKWDLEMDLVHEEDPENKSFLQGLGQRLWRYILHEMSPEEPSITLALEILDILQLYDFSNLHHTRYLIQSLQEKTATLPAQLIHLSLLSSPFKSERQFISKTRSNTSHVPGILVKTMWDTDAADLEPRRVTLRLSWLLHDTDGMYPLIKEMDFAQYLSIWCDHHDSWHQSDPVSSSSSAHLYLRVLISLLTREQELWAKELDLYGHLTHIQNIYQDPASSADDHLLCCISFLLMADGIRDDAMLQSKCYSDEWVKFVVRVMTLEHKDLILGEVLDKPMNGILLMKALHGYLHRVKSYGKIAGEDLRNFSVFLGKLDGRLKLWTWPKEMKALWDRDVQPMLDATKQSAAENAATGGVTTVPLAEELDSGIGNDDTLKGLEDVWDGTRSASVSDANKILQHLQTTKINRTTQLTYLEYLCRIFATLSSEDVRHIFETSLSLAPVSQMLVSTVWIYDLDPAVVDANVRRQVADTSELRLELRRIWLDRSEQEVHDAFKDAHYVLYLSAWHDTNPTQSEQYLKTTATLLGRFPNTWLSTLEHDGHIERIAHLMESSAIQGVPRQKVRVIQWMSFKLFLAMWHHKSEGTNDPYLTEYCRERLISFLSSITPHPPTDDIHASIEAEDAFPVVMTARDFVTAGCTYLEAVAAARPLSEGEGTVIAAFERFTHPSLCRATRMADEQDWNQDINDYIARVADLRNESRNSD
ncbi:hypothetical protein FRC02_002160 [Tulasnella sp. 418]|nr:hypothetical protein FRC02_002160 [Tulasnella sp. 418]